MKRTFRSMPSLNSRHAAGSKAIVVFVCRGCEVHHKSPSGKPPRQCYCGRMDFDRFDSVTEATRWATLRMLEARGKVRDLQRQVPFQLYAHRDGHPVKVALYVADFVYTRVETGERVVEDSKPAAGIDDLARLKLKWMEAQGVPVLITTGI